ncbi:hypothetical protein POSPLADRAFT_1134070 [Postia placenta MAD-698-R-SB12]|uniref:M-phase inducer phosphatase n=1 Tax=Postia placenta MAD-698-R-SB12 TaxID=670580 RepID=A0A1X6N7Y2_9APHY|nr:hypothetical protein POSPLADRAFT_1134070 [Postia placenta MAD-698-R-SB12]OSX64749.1 hypothetical protein POSPLADRAFT_1134070 [Postia placenta MAD-698-R-SB12]
MSHWDSKLKQIRRADLIQPYKKQKRHHRSSYDIENMAPFISTSTSSKQYLAPPPAPSRKPSQRLMQVRNDIDDFLSSEADLDLELSFASTMSLHSPQRDTVDLASENDNSNYVPMDISPAPQRIAPPSFKDQGKPTIGRPRAFTSSARLFGKDMSNDSSSASSLKSVAKSTDTSGTGKRLQRAALPFEWMSFGQNNNGYSQPQNIPSSPAASDAMDIDTSFVYVQSSSAPRDGPLSAAPTITAFDEMTSEAEVSQVIVVESPTQPFPKKRRSLSPEEAANEEAALGFSPAPSSPVVRKLERMASGPLLRKPMLSGLGAPMELNENKKRPRRPVLSAMLTSSDVPILQPRSAYPADAYAHGEKENGATKAPSYARHVLPPVRRAFSAMLPPNVLDQSLESEDASFEVEGPDMSSPAQAYAKRQQVKTIRRCDGTDDFRPLTGATALMRRDTEAMKGLKRSEDREGRSGLGSFGDNEAYGKILPCHRVREDGLMRVTSETLDKLIDGVYDSQLASFYIIDCRFDYEYNGGHIPGAMNINTTTGVEEFLLGSNAIKPLPSISGDTSKKTVLIFHCEFSVKRAPTFAKHLRSKDRAMNNHVYPNIHYPEVYVLEGGYNQYFQRSATRCQPMGYVQMDDPHYAASRREDLDQFRKGKFGRTKSYAYGDGKLVSGVSVQPKRNTAPSGGTTALFAAANAARTRRGGGSGSGLQMLKEDSVTSHHTDDEDTDIGDSPCPPPAKSGGVVFKGKKIGRLARAETYDSARLSAGY